jgi:hypothetical protein
VIVIDTGTVVAAANRKDRHYDDCVRFRTTAVATLDRRHFGVVRPAHVAAFTLLP